VLGFEPRSSHLPGKFSSAPNPRSHSRVPPKVTLGSLNKDSGPALRVLMKQLHLELIH
jgi:hypothetical protein